MQKIIYTQNYKEHRKGDMEEISNNVAFGLVDKGVAQYYNGRIERLLRRGIEKPPIDKMMRADKGKINLESDKYKTK